MFSLHTTHTSFSNSRVYNFTFESKPFPNASISEVWCNMCVYHCLCYHSPFTAWRRWLFPHRLISYISCILYFLLFCLLLFHTSIRCRCYYWRWFSSWYTLPLRRWFCNIWTPFLQSFLTCRSNFRIHLTAKSADPGHLWSWLGNRFRFLICCSLSLRRHRSYLWLCICCSCQSSKFCCHRWARRSSWFRLYSFLCLDWWHRFSNWAVFGVKRGILIFYRRSSLSRSSAWHCGFFICKFFSIDLFTAFVRLPTFKAGFTDLWILLTTKRTYPSIEFTFI